MCRSGASESPVPFDARCGRGRENVVEMSKLVIFSELWSFMRVRKKWWLMPIILFMVLFGGLLVLTQNSALAPFIYALF